MHLTYNPSLPPVVYRLRGQRPTAIALSLPIYGSPIRPPSSPDPGVSSCTSEPAALALHRASRVARLTSRCESSPRRLGVVRIKSRPVIGNSLARRHPSAFRFEMVEEPLESADTCGFTDDAAV
jgi:hypothetical protein